MKRVFRIIFSLSLVLAVVAAGVSSAASAAPSGGSIEVNGQIADTSLVHITYDANGGVGGSNGPDVAPGTNDTVFSQANAGVSRGGYTFTGWNTAPDGTGTSYSPGNIIVLGGNVTLYAQWKEAPYTEYTFNTEFDVFTGAGNRTAEIGADYAKFVGLFINGILVDASNYVVSGGSTNTVITLKESYLKTLANGSYTITAEFTDGSAESTLVVNVADSPSNGGTTPGTDNANTGDNHSIWLLPILLGVLGLGVIMIALAKKLKKPRSF